MKKTVIAILLVIEAALLGIAGYLAVRYSENKKMITALVKKVEALDQENKTLIATRKRLEGELKGQTASGLKAAEDKKQLEENVLRLQGQLQIIEGLKEGDPQALRVRLKQLKINLSDRLPENQSPDAVVSAVVSVAPQENDLHAENRKLLDETFKDLDGLSQNNKGIAYSRSRQFDKAIEAYEKALQRNPRDAEALYNLGLLYEQGKKDAAKAIEYYKKYLEHAPAGADDRDAVQGTIGKLATFGVTNEHRVVNKVLLNSVSNGK